MRTFRWAVRLRSRKFRQEKVVYIDAGDESMAKHKAARRANGLLSQDWYAVDCWLA
jgi:hypothetical protein